MYNFIKASGTLNLAQLQEIVLKHYAFSDDENPDIMQLTKFDIPADITLRYTDHSLAQKNFLNIILRYYEHLIDSFINRINELS
jgi:hypothetical protein